MAAAARLAAAKTVPLALVHQADALHEHLKAALDELGANVVYDTHASGFSYAALDGSGAEVVVINLDPDSDDFDALADLLGDETRRVIINDGEVTSKLSGWDLARWTRHLAAKLIGVDEVLPQRPEGAQAIPVRVKAAAPAQGEADKFQIAGSELAAALGADTAARMEATRAELVTNEEPVGVAIYQRPTDVPDYAVDAAELTQHLGDLPSAPSFSLDLDVSQIDAAIGVDTSDDVQEESFEPAVTTSRHDAPTLEIPSAVVASAAARDATGSPSDGDGAHDEFDHAAAAFAQRATPANEPDEFSFILSEEDASLLGGDPEDAFFRLPTAPEAEAAETDFSSSVEALGFVEATDDFPREDVPDLDALLRSAGPKDDNPPPSVRAKPTSDAPVDAAKPAPAASGSAKTEALKERTLADFESALVGLSLVDDDENTPYVAPIVEAATPVPSGPARDFSSALSSLSLEPIDESGDGEAANGAAPSGRASFGLGTDAPQAMPAPVAAPKSIAPAPKAVEMATDVSDDLSIGLDFDFTEDTEISADSIVRMGAVDPTIDELAVDLDSELDALLRREAELASTPASRVERVWVLGASIGGPDAVREFLAALPATTPATFLLAQHMGADFLELMVQQLAKASPLKVRVAMHGDLAAHGEVVVVPLAEAIDVEQNGYVRISPAADTSPYTPSIDRVMRAVADRYGKNAGAIIFSGMAHDAIEGASYIRQKGGTVWVQSPASCVISSMVDGALEAGVVAYQGTPVELAKQFLDEVAR